MNKKGIMFTLMTVILIIAVLALNSAIKSTSLEAQRLDSIVSFMTVTNRYGNIYRNIVDLKRLGTSRQVIERILPFRYEMDENWIIIKRNFPIDSYEVGTYFDTLNLYSIFAKAQSVSPRADLNTIQNSDWYGIETNLHFLFEPFCYQYAQYGLDMVRFEPSTSGKCTGAFNFSDLNVFEANIKLLYVDDDYDRVRCNGIGSCPSQPYSATDPNPYYKVVINDSKCQQCNLPAKAISSHIASGETMQIEVFCENAPCESKPIWVTINKNYNGTMEITHQGPRFVDANMMAGFEGAIDGFYLLDMNISVQSIDGKSVRTNNPSVLN